MAGFAIAVTLVPQGLGYGQVAGLHPVAGLYTAVGAMVVFALFTSSRLVAVGPSSTMAIMTFAAVSGRASGDAHRTIALSACLALLPGRLRGLATFMSGPVVLGYLAGTAVQVMAGQVGTLLGVPTHSNRPMVKLWQVLTHLEQTHVVTAVVGVSSLVALIVLKKALQAVPALRAVPPTPVVCVVAVIVSAAVDLGGHGVALTGGISGGLPAPTWPDVTAGDVWALLPAAAGMAMIASIEDVAALRRAGASEGRVSLVRESVAMGAASAAVGFLGGFASMASTQRTLSARSAGAHSQLYQLAGAGFVVVGLLTTGPVIGLLPKTVLAAVVMVSTSHLIDVAGFKELWQGWRSEALLALATMVAVLGLGVLHGLLVAVILALLQLLRRVTWPHDAMLAVTADGRTREVAPDEPTDADVLMYRVDAPLFFANAGRVQEKILSLAAARSPFPRYVVLDAEAVFHVDATAAEILAQLTVDLRERHCELVLARPRESVLAVLRANAYASGATRRLRVFPTVGEAYATLRAS
ncbi:SulP family inorganic anion transporter [Streptomyces sp. NBC_00996]|uniref:SulP family inorganic anion transporter n=1 Tax=Streptomyces sp. NBC_00996 TaxID=2903710 RepID=UPI003865328A|nr:SulP family inorganic anion transporter [Streptomyces sp. NBC_00996]